MSRRPKAARLAVRRKRFPGRAEEGGSSRLPSVLRLFATAGGATSNCSRLTFFFTSTCTEKRGWESMRSPATASCSLLVGVEADGARCQKGQRFFP